MQFTQKLDRLETRFDELNAQMADPTVISDAELYRKVTKEHSSLSELVGKYREWKKVEEGLSQARPMLQDSDPGMKAMAEEEVAQLEPERARIEEELNILLLPKDPNDEKNAPRRRAQRGADSLARAIAVLKIAPLAGLIVYAIWLLIQGTRQGMVRWRAAIRLAIPATLLFPVAPLLSVGLMLKNYRTDVPLETFQAMTYVSLAMGALFGFLLMAGAAALVVTFYPDAVPALRQRNRAAMAFDAVAALLAAAGLALAVHQFQGILLDRFHAQAVLSIASPDIIASTAPALAALANAVRGLLTDAALLGLVALLAWQLTGPAKQRRMMRYGAALLALCATLPSEVRTPGEFLLHYGISLAMAGAGIAFCWFFARRNYRSEERRVGKECHSR